MHHAGGDLVPVVVNDQNDTRDSAYASRRTASAPFFFDVTAFRETVQTRHFAFKEVGDNGLAEKNVLSLVLEFKLSRRSARRRCSRLSQKP